MRKRRARFLALSLVLHLLLLGLTLQVIHSLRHPAVVTSQSPLKFYPAMLFIPGGSNHVKPSPKPYGRKVPLPAPRQNPTTDLAVNAAPAPPAGHLPSAQHDPTPGNGVDTQSADPAFPVFSPRPPVTDRALLPALNQQVIVDVKVSASGDVLEATLVKGIGNALDQIVLSTVKTWRFHPAMLNGSAVPTEDELIFPFDQNYPIADS
ncbi:MAG TPA: TonB family protein [Terracidiphilus sp.]|nr:TonB family protein [Terracidiphilus sp.]